MGIKKRSVAAAPASEKATEEAIRAFAEGADKDPDYKAKMDPSAPRNGSGIPATNLPFNAYEWDLLTRACEKTSRTKKNFIRMAMIEKAKEVLEED